ncbi:MAG TPA: type II secretion system protein [Candidatus Babeliales bacterium]|nr:type II secretion system protein [Candidatus Babeliales bacterium]
MIHFKNHKRGFTLIECLLAMMITGLALTPIFILHSMIMQRVGRSSRKYDFIVLCKNVLYEARQKQEPEAQSFSFEKKEVDFDTTLTYSLEKGIDQKSSLALLSGLHKEVVNISWTEAGQKKQEQLVTFVYKKPEQKKS